MVKQMVKLKNLQWQILVFRASTALCAVSFLLTISVTFLYRQQKHQELQKAKQEAKQETMRFANEIDRQLKELQQLPTAIAGELSSETLSDEQIRDRLLSAISKNTSLRRLGIAYAPYVHSPNRRLYAPSYIKRSDESEPSYREFINDYTKPEYDWYHQPLKEGALWLEPSALEEASALIEFGVPFYRRNGQAKEIVPAGVVSATYSLSKIAESVNNISFSKASYGFLVSKQGVFLAHPNKDLVKHQKTLIEIAQGLKSKSLEATAQKALTGSAREVFYKNTETGQFSWGFSEPIPSTGWTVGVVFIQEEILCFHCGKFKRMLLIIVLGAIATGFFLSVLVFQAYRGRVKGLWAVALSTSFFCMVGIGSIWAVALAEREQGIASKNRIKLLRKSQLEEFLVKRAQRADAFSDVYIPTGVFVQSLEFKGANNVFFKGYVWQKYNLSDHTGITRGFLLPEGIDATIEEAYRYRKGDVETIGWQVEATLRQNFDYSRYPFDFKDIWIRLIHKDDVYRNVILIPDFDSYDVISPTTLPGVEEDFVLPGWLLKSSFFQYYLNNYNTNFGIRDYTGQRDFPELYFTVIIQRNFLTVFVQNIMTPLVVSFLLFFIQILIIQSAESKENLGFTALEIVSSCGAFLFIVTLDQIQLRREIITAGIMYIEYFYFVMYLLIISVAINGILFATGSKIRFVHYKNNLIPKLLYWPGLSILLLIITTLVFY